MIQRKQNIRLLVVLSLLIGASLIFGWATRDRGGVSFDRDLFKLEENTVITTVELGQPKEELRLEYIGGRWEVNGEYAMDLGMRDVFFSVLSQVEVRRPAPTEYTDSLLSIAETRGVRVTILNDLETVKSYVVLGDEQSFVTYFIDPEDQKVYYVHIPGYISYVAGIYHVPERDWRDRLIWPIDWTQLRRLEINQTRSSQTVEFTYTRDFIEVVGLEAMDTATVVNYLQRLGSLEALSFLDDSLNPETDRIVATIRVEEIGGIINELTILETDTLPDTYFGLLNTTQAVSFRRSDIDALLVETSYFGRNPSR